MPHGVLGGHVERCVACGYERPAYNSCRNRHCPKCQCLQSARWVARRLDRLLPVHHFHVVFTLQGELLFRLTCFDAQLCPACRQRSLVRIPLPDCRGPPPPPSLPT